MERYIFCSKSYYPPSNQHASHFADAKAIIKRVGHQYRVPSVPVVSRWLPPGNRTFLAVASMVVT